MTQEALTLLSTQTIGLERLLREFWSRGHACSCSSMHGPGWICAGFEQILRKLFTTCLLAKVYHPACSWKAFVTLNNIYSFGPANSRFCKVFLMATMRLRPANSALAVEVMQGGLVLETKRKAGRLLSSGLALGLGEPGGCCCSSCCWRDEVHGKFFRRRNSLFKVQTTLLSGRWAVCGLAQNTL